MTEPRSTGPVSTAIEQEVLGELRRQGIVVWLDKDSAYTGFVDGLIDKQKKRNVSTSLRQRISEFTEAKCCLTAAKGARLLVLQVG